MCDESIHHYPDGKKFVLRDLMKKRNSVDSHAPHSQLNVR
jgi:hypothetical protein